MGLRGVRLTFPLTRWSRGRTDTEYCTSVSVARGLPPTSLALQTRPGNDHKQRGIGTGVRVAAMRVCEFPVHAKLERYGSGYDSVTESRGARRGSPWNS
eukprot:6209922-Pleurochrysis_carterae.AAC.2